MNTPPFVGHYVSLFEKKGIKGDPNSTPKYSLQAVFPASADLSQLKAEASAVRERKWPNPETRPRKLRNPFRKHEEMAVEDPKTGKLIFPPGYEAGGTYITLAAVDKPPVVDANVQDILDKSLVKSGDYFIATVSCYAYDHPANKGVSFGLECIQKIKDGERVGRPKVEPSKCFQAIPGVAADGIVAGDSEGDWDADGDDDIPF